MKKKPGISVIVCCYNSASRLQPTLQHLSQQQSGAVNWEIILVDNASTDGTAKKAKELWETGQSAIPFRVVEEPRPGLSAARMKGYHTALYDYLLFCDDDNWLQHDYIAIAFHLMQSLPEAAVIGGQAMPAFETSPPAWFSLHQGSYAVGKQYPASREVTTEPGKLWGAGAVYRRQALDYLYSHGFVHFLTDRIGNKIVSGGDHELCYALRLAGYKLYYDESLLLTHYMPASRLNWNWFINFFGNAAATSIYFDPYQKSDQKNRGLSGYLKETVFYELYISLIKLRRMPFKWKWFMNKPAEGAGTEWLSVYYERKRMGALLKDMFHYRSRLHVVKQAEFLAHAEQKESNG